MFKLFRSKSKKSFKNLNKSKISLFSLMLIFIAETGWANDIYYCNTTATIITVFHEVPNQPIYTQKVDNYISTFKFKRGKQSITINANNGDTILPYHSTAFSKGNDYFFASKGFSQFQFVDGKVVWDRFGNIMTADCDKF